MLTYKVGTQNISRDNILLDVSAITWNDTSNEITIECINHGLHSGETVLFTRADGSEIGYRREIPVKQVINADSFVISAFAPMFLPISNGEVENLRFLPDVQNKRKYLKLSLAKGERHDILSNRDSVVVKELVYGNYDNYIEGMRRCDGDFVVYEDRFLYQVTAGVEKYIFPTEESEKKNTTADISILPIGELLAYVTKPDDTPKGRTWEYSDGVLTLHNCFVPSLSNGHDSRTEIYWQVEDPTLAGFIANNASNLTIYTRDERFITPAGEASENGLSCVFKPGAALYKTSYSLAVSNIVSQDFGINLFQEELLRSEYVEKIIANAKNGIVDYEKQCFTPVYESGNAIYDVNEIIFNLHFREREVQFDEEIDACTYGEWKTNNNLYWNNYKYYGEDRLVAVPSGTTPDKADLLGYLGFTDNDIYYTRNRVSKSFLRLLFFDSTDRRSQKLLYTSVLYLNAASLYEKYVADVRMGANGEAACEGGEPEIVYSENAPRRLDASFSCKNKYDSTYSSEGFYLYLFPGLLDENGEATIYMKAEFNHAKYGYTIPMIMPMNENGYPMSPISPQFPIDYVATKVANGKSYEYVDTQKLFNDMYIPIKIKFDASGKRYVWYVEKGLQSDGIAKFNMFEPKINRAEGINVELDKYTIGWEGGNIDGRVIITDNSPWTVSDASDGVSVSPNEGIGNTDIVITLPANGGDDDMRTLTVTFSGANSYVRAEIVQDAGGLELSVSPSLITSSWEGEEVDIEIIADDNIEWTIWTSSYFIDLRGLERGVGTILQHTIEIKRSISTEKEIGEIFVQDVNHLGAPRTIRVELEAAPHSLSVSPVSMEFPESAMEPEEALSLTIYDEENIGWTIDEDTVQPWLSFYEATTEEPMYQGIGTTELLFYSTEENMGYEERGGYMRIEGGWNIPLEEGSMPRVDVYMSQAYPLVDIGEIFIQSEGTYRISSPPEGAISNEYEFHWTIFISDSPETSAEKTLIWSGDNYGSIRDTLLWGDSASDPYYTFDVGSVKYIHYTLTAIFSGWDYNPEITTEGNIMIEIPEPEEPSEEGERIQVPVTLPHIIV